MYQTPKKYVEFLVRLFIFGLGFLTGLMFFTYSHPIKKQQDPKPQIIHKKIIKVQPITQPVFVPEPKPQTERDKIDKHIEVIGKLYHISPALIKSIIYQESRYDPKARTGKCVGLMQVNTYWHKDRAKSLGVTDLYDPYGNILVGVDYLSELFKKYEDPALVLMLYNMKHKTAFSLHKKGKISDYAREVLARSDSLQNQK